MNKEEELQKLREDLVHYYKYLESLYKLYEINDDNLPEIKQPNVELPKIKYLCKISGYENYTNIIIYSFLIYELYKVDILLNVLEKKYMFTDFLHTRVMDAIKKYQEEFNVIRNNNCITITCPVMINTMSYLYNHVDQFISKENTQLAEDYDKLLSDLTKKSKDSSVLSLKNIVKDIESLNYNNVCNCDDYNSINSENQLPTNGEESSKEESSKEESSKEESLIEQPKKPLITNPSRIAKLKKKVKNGFIRTGATLKGVLNGLYQAGTLPFRALGAFGSLFIGRGGKKSRKRKHNKLKKKRKSTRKKRRKSNKKHR